MLSKSGAVPSSTNSCGIHSVKISPGGGYIATGGRNPNYLAIYSLPHLLPLALGEVSDVTIIITTADLSTLKRLTVLRCIVKLVIV